MEGGAEGYHGGGRIGHEIVRQGTGGPCDRSAGMEEVQDGQTEIQGDVGQSIESAEVETPACRALLGEGIREGVPGSRGIVKGKGIVSEMPVHQFQTGADRQARYFFLKRIQI